MNVVYNKPTALRVDVVKLSTVVSGRKDSLFFFLSTNALIINK